MESKGFPQVLGKKDIFVSPWMRLVEKEVAFAEHEEHQKFYTVMLEDYVTSVGITPDGRIPIIRQYRPAVECFTLELPAGTMNENETPDEACRREMLEETGHSVEKLVRMGSYYPDTGRLGNLQHAYLALLSPTPVSQPEKGLEVFYYDWLSVFDLIQRGEFIHQLHLSVFMMAYSRRKEIE